MKRMLSYLVVVIGVVVCSLWASLFKFLVCFYIDLLFSNLPTIVSVIILVVTSGIICAPATLVPGFLSSVLYEVCEGINESKTQLRFRTVAWYLIISSLLNIVFSAMAGGLVEALATGSQMILFSIFLLKNAKDASLNGYSTATNHIVPIEIAVTFTMLLFLAGVMLGNVGVVTSYSGDDREVYATADSYQTSSYSEKENSVEDSHVWVSSTGSKYHKLKSCSGMNDPRLISIENALQQNYTKCSKCW